MMADSGTRRKSIGAISVASACTSARARQKCEDVPVKAISRIHGHSSADGVRQK